MMMLQIVQLEYMKIAHQKYYNLVMVEFKEELYYVANEFRILK